MKFRLINKCACKHKNTFKYIEQENIKIANIARKNCLLHKHRWNTRIFPVTKIWYPVNIKFLSFTCEDTTVVMTTSVSGNKKLPSQHRARLLFSFTNQSSWKTRWDFQINYQISTYERIDGRFVPMTDSEDTVRHKFRQVVSNRTRREEEHWRDSSRWT